MAHIELNLDSPVACKGERGAYVGVLYYLSKRTGRMTQFDIDDPQYNPAHPEKLIHDSLGRVGTKIGLEVEPEQLIALALHRICIRRRHDDGETSANEKVRLERVASLAIASAATDIEKIMPLNAVERNFSAHGIGYARRSIPGLTPIRPLVHLPITSAESRSDPVIGVIKSLATARTMAEQPYVALHGSEHGFIEQIVTPDQL